MKPGERTKSPKETFVEKDKVPKIVLGKCEYLKFMAGYRERKKKRDWKTRKDTIQER